MSDSAHNPDDYCYRHPDRLSFVLCERCGRTICIECQNHVDGRVLCPDDAQALAEVTSIAAARAAKNRRSRRVRRTPAILSRVGTDTPIVTYGILGILVLVFLVDTVTRGLLTTHLGVFPTGSGLPDVLHQPWSLLTSMVLSGGIIGLLFNGYATFVLGRQLERVIGHQKLIVLYLMGGLGASVFAFLLDGFVTSAIGAVFALVGTTVIMARRMGGNPLFLYITCAISLVFAILLGGWQAAIGGGLTGAAVAATWIFDDDSRHGRTRLILVGVVVVLLLLAIVRALAFSA
jgi:membrane associated rhomboid family serine protease